MSCHPTSLNYIITPFPECGYFKTKHALNPYITSLIYNWLREHGHAAIKVVSNLPYNISTPVVINLLENDLPISEMVLMLQQEITERMTALPGTREYGMLSVIIRLFSEVEVVKSLPRKYSGQNRRYIRQLLRCVYRKRSMRAE